jgi:ribonucleoside-diphosphate reductase alpha chain
MGGESYATSAELQKLKDRLKDTLQIKMICLELLEIIEEQHIMLRPSEYEGLTVKPIGINQDLCPEYLSEAAKKSGIKL